MLKRAAILLLLSSPAHADAIDDARTNCERYGYTPKTAEFIQCVERAHKAMIAPPASQAVDVTIGKKYPPRDSCRLTVAEVAGCARASYARPVGQPMSALDCERQILAARGC